MAEVATKIIPVLEYACPVWHTSLSMYLSDPIETIRNRCIKTICTGGTILKSIISQLSFKDASNCASRIFGKCTMLITNQRNYGLTTHNNLPAPLVMTDWFRRSLIPWRLERWQHNNVIIEFYYNSVISLV